MEEKCRMRFFFGVELWILSYLCSVSFVAHSWSISQLFFVDEMLGKKDQIQTRSQQHLQRKNAFVSMRLFVIPF